MQICPCILACHVLHVVCTFSCDSCLFSCLWIAVQITECRMCNAKYFIQMVTEKWGVKLHCVFRYGCEEWYHPKCIDCTHWDWEKGSRFIQMLEVWSIGHVSRINVQNRQMVCVQLWNSLTLRKMTLRMIRNKMLIFKMLLIDVKMWSFIFKICVLFSQFWHHCSFDLNPWLFDQVLWNDLWITMLRISNDTRADHERKNFKKLSRFFVNFWAFRKRFPNYFCLLRANE